jgi:hypothetical protein
VLLFLAERQRSAQGFSPKFSGPDARLGTRDQQISLELRDGVEDPLGYRAKGAGKINATQN